jgi:DNA-binding NarL/FixJ family response regulator
LPPLRLIVVDDHEVVREGLISTLRRDRRFAVVGAAATGAGGAALTRRLHPDAAIVDLRLPDMSGEDACRAIRTGSPATAVLILTTYLSEETVRRAMAAGAAAYVTKAAGVEELKRALARLSDARHGEATATPSPPQVVNQLHELATRRQGGERTTPQQERVLDLAAQGLTNRAIGDAMFISESTVRFHMQKLKAALDAKTRTELIAKAIRLGLIVPAPEDLSEPA